VFFGILIVMVLAATGYASYKGVSFLKRETILKASAIVGTFLGKGVVKSSDLGRKAKSESTKVTRVGRRVAKENWITLRFSAVEFYKNFKSTRRPVRELLAKNPEHRDPKAN
jgi:hypothetical protein